MQATLNGHVIAASDETVDVGGYAYFPAGSVQLALLEKSPRTAKDLECPHGVQFYDVVVNGARHARNAWAYEAPRPSMAATAGRFGFWEDVTVG